MGFCRGQKFLAFIYLTWLLDVVNALHFYLDASERRCFIEELPTDTVVEGLSCYSSWSILMLIQIGHYRALEWLDSEQKYVENNHLGIVVEVDVCYLLWFLLHKG